MEIFGGVASGITIAEVAVKLAKFASMLKKADEEFERYCASLSGLHQVACVAGDVTRNMNGLDALNINLNGQQCSLVEFCVSTFSIAIDEAQKLLNRLERFEQPGDGIRAKIKKFCRDKRRELRLALGEEDIQARMKNVEAAKTSLQMAIAIATLVKTDSGLTDIQSSIRGLREQMESSFNSLQQRHDESVQKKAPLRVYVSSKPSRRASSVRALFSRTRKSGPGAPSSLLPHEAYQPPSQSPLQATPEESHALGADQVESAREDLSNNMALNLDGLKLRKDKLSEAAGVTPVATTDDNAHDDDIEVVFDDGQVVFIPGGSAQARDSDADGTSSSQLTPIKPVIRMTEGHDQPTSLGLVPHGAPSRSDAEEFVHFLETGTLPDEEEEPPTPVCTPGGAQESSFKLSAAARLDMERPVHSECGEGPFNATEVASLCVKNISLSEDEDQHLLLLELPCHTFPTCSHAKVTVLREGGRVTIEELTEMPHIIPVLAESSDGSGTRLVDPVRGFDVDLYESCETPCTHTKAEKSDGEAVQVSCVDPISFAVWPHLVPMEDSDDGDSSSLKSCCPQCGHRFDGSDAGEETEEEEGRRPGANPPPYSWTEGVVVRLLVGLLSGQAPR